METHIAKRLRRCSGDRSTRLSSGAVITANRRSPRAEGDAGYVMVMFALLLIPLIAMTGFSVDLGAWYAQATKMQRAADAASLAGVVYAGDASAWNTIARDVATRNGYTDGVNGVTVNVTKLSESKINVSIANNGATYFSRLFIQAERLTRKATSEYIVPVPMGSPENALGNDPERNFSPNFWLNIAGQATDKVSGDRHTAGACSVTWGCSGGLNTEYRPDGYMYKVSVGATGMNPLNIDVYDPAMVYQGDTCGTNTPSAAEFATLQTQYGAANAARYQGGNDKWCTGDQSLNGANIKTTYIVRAPDNTPLDDTDNQPICAITFDAYNADVFSFLNTAVAANNSPRGTEKQVFSDHFHKDFTICQVPAGQLVTGDYIVQVRTNADLTSAPANPTVVANSSLSIGSLATAASPNTGGHNRTAMRAGFGAVGSPGWATNVRLSASGRLPIYVNTGTSTLSTTSFYLARITPQYAGKTLQLNFWDIGDIAAGGIYNPGQADFTINPPADATNPPTACSFTRDGGAMAGVTISGCSVSGMTSANYNGKLTQANINIPTDYTCDTSIALGCWFKINVTIKGQPTDTTTWSANILGDPVHLIE